MASWTWVHLTVSTGLLGSHVPGDCLSGQTLDNGPYAGAMTASGEDRATGALAASGIEYTLTRHGRVGSLAEAAAARGVEVHVEVAEDRKSVV